MKRESVRLPSYGYGIFQVWKRNFLHFKKTWFNQCFWTVLEPLLLLLAIGYGVGAFVPDVFGLSYVDFFFPSLLAMTSMLVSFFEATYGNFGKLYQHKTYSTMLLSSLAPNQIVLGDILWAATKGTFSAVAVALIAGLFGHLESLMFLPSLGVIFLSSFLFASLGMVVVSIVKTYDHIIYPTSGLIVPMALFSGTYFPVDQLPYGLKYISYIFPLTHSVVLVRGFLLENLQDWQIIVHVSVLLLFSVFLCRIAMKSLRDKLIP